MDLFTKRSSDINSLGGQDDEMTNVVNQDLLILLRWQTSTNVPSMSQRYSLSRTQHPEIILVPHRNGPTKKHSLEFLLRHHDELCSLQSTGSLYDYLVMDTTYACGNGHVQTCVSSLTRICWIMHALESGSAVLDW